MSVKYLHFSFCQTLCVCYLQDSREVNEMMNLAIKRILRVSGLVAAVVVASQVSANPGQGGNKEPPSAVGKGMGSNGRTQIGADGVGANDIER